MPRAPETKLLHQDESPFESWMERPEAHLIRKKDNRSVIMRETLLRIGRSLRDVDYVISDNPAIGRHHADILFHDDRYYIIDQNSKNHVFVDGVMIPPNEEYPLPDQTVIRLADEEYDFRVIR